jgi:hypothetical protein
MLKSTSPVWPKITEELIKLIVSAPGGKVASLGATAS